METRASYIIVGGFVLVMLAGLFAFTLWVAKVQLEEALDTYYVYFSGSVTGLWEGSPVRYRGVPVGTVRDIRIDPANVGRVRVTIGLKPGTPIKTDSTAALEMQGLTGGAYVQVTGGTEASPLLKETSPMAVPVLPSRPSSLAEVFESAPHLLREVLTLVERGSDLLDTANRQAITETLANLRALTGDLRATQSALTGALEGMGGLSVELRHTVETLGPHLDQTVTAAHRTLETLDHSARTLTGDAHAIGQSLRQGTDELSRAIAENRRPIQDFTTTGLYEATLLVTQLRDLAGQLGRLVQRVEADPSAVLFGGRRGGVEVPAR